LIHAHRSLIYYTKLIIEIANVPVPYPRIEWDESYCVITADSDKIEEVGKIWIPEDHPETGKPLWIDYKRSSVQDIMEYVASRVPNPEKALRFSYMQHDQNKLQMVIPTDTVNNDGLGLWAKCWKTEKELEEGLEEELDLSSATVDWMEWDIDGKPVPKRR
jgi:hypothetical protein